VVSYTEDVPKACTNQRCTKNYADPSAARRPESRWLKCRWEDSSQDAPSKVETMPAPPDEEPVKVNPETWVSDLASKFASMPIAAGATAEEFRSEWVAERVAARLDKSGLESVAMPSEVCLEVRRHWDIAEALYDEGRRRGHLP
jgi:hypothetical protein